MRARLAVAALLLGGAAAFGCSAVLGLTEGSALDDAGAVDGTAPDVASGCAPGQKSCGGSCVAVDDPRYGCTPDSCGACVAQNATTLTCQGGQCAITGCVAGRGDCDKATANGCETDTTSGEHCGSCTKACADPTPICSGATCIDAAACDGSICGTSCVDTKTSVPHCGSCSVDCTNPQPPHTTPNCVDGTCAYACAPGASDCDKNMANGCECTTGCSGTSCCPAGGCVPIDGGQSPDGGGDSGGGIDAGSDSGVDSGGDACPPPSICLGPGAPCNAVANDCCCPMKCLPPNAPALPDAGLGTTCQ